MIKREIKAMQKEQQILTNKVVKFNTFNALLKVRKQKREILKFALNQWKQATKPINRTFVNHIGSYL